MILLLLLFITCCCFCCYCCCYFSRNGVPGLDRVLVRWEDSVVVVEVSKRWLLLLSPKELAEKPFVYNNNNNNIVTIQNNNNNNEVKEICLDVRKVLNSSSTTKTTTTTTAAAAAKITTTTTLLGTGWLLSGIRVKVLSSTTTTTTGQLGTVIDVIQRGEVINYNNNNNNNNNNNDIIIVITKGSVRLDNNNKVLGRVRESSLLLLSPAIGKSCIIVYGEYKGLLQQQ